MFEEKSRGRKSETKSGKTIRVCEERVYMRKGERESKVSSDTAAVDLIPS